MPMSNTIPHHDDLTKYIEDIIRKGGIGQVMDALTEAVDTLARDDSYRHQDNMEDVLHVLEDAKEQIIDLLDET